MAGMAAMGTTAFTVTGRAGTMAGIAVATMAGTGTARAITIIGTTVTGADLGFLPARN